MLSHPLYINRQVLYKRKRKEKKNRKRYKLIKEFGCENQGNWHNTNSNSYRKTNLFGRYEFSILFYHFFSLSLQESSSKINKTWGQVFPSTRGKVRKKILSCATELTTELVLLAEGPEIFLKSIAEGPEMLAKTCIYCIKMYMTEGTWVIMNQLQRDLNDINNQWTRINAGC